MGSNMIKIIDNFYEDPYARRKEALSCEYQKAETFPGMDSVKSFYLDEALKKIGILLGRSIRWDRYLFSGHYRFSLASDKWKQDIHVDTFLTGSPFPQWVGNGYLSLPQDCRGGISFWKHRKTGLQEFPTPKEQVRVSRMAKIPNTPWEIGNYFIQEGLDRSRWTEIKKVSMVFNRLVIFKPNCFHSHTSLFGTTRENGRIVHMLPFDEVDYFIKTVKSYHKQQNPQSRRLP